MMNCETMVRLVHEMYEVAAMKTYHNIVAARIDLQTVEGTYGTEF